MRWHIEVLKKYLVLRGRASRSEFWYFTLYYLIILCLAAVIDAATGSFNPGMGLGRVSGIYFASTFLPMFGVSVRRLHDIGRSGWWVLIGFIPPVGGLVLLVIAMFASQPGDNEYGPQPNGHRQPPVHRGGHGSSPRTPGRRRGLTLLRGFGVAGCALLVLAGAGRFWWSRHGDDLIASGKASTEQGREMGRRLQESACVDEAVQRHRSSPGVSLDVTVTSGLWLHGCLEASRPQASFCEGVPAKSEILALAAWTNMECSRHGIADATCGVLFQNVSTYCASAERVAKVATIQSARIEASAAEPATERQAERVALSDATVEALMRKSGVWALLGTVSKQVRDSLEQATVEPARQNELARVRSAANLAFSVDRMRASVGRQLSQALSTVQASQAMNWLDSDLGRRITSLEETANSRSDPDQLVREGMHALASQSHARVAKLRQLVQLSRQADSSTSVAISMGLALARGAARSGDTFSGTDLEALKLQIEQARPAMTKRFEQMALAVSALIYREIGDEELDLYLAFLKSPTGQSYQSAVLDALESTLTEAAEAAAAAISSAAKVST